VARELRPFEESLDWEGAVGLLAAVDPEKAERLSYNDWRRLARHLEAARAGPRREGRAPRSGYDFRSFFLSPRDRQALFRRIDERCLAMLDAGLLEEVAGLLCRGVLDPESPPGRAIGYRQPIDYLLRPEPREGDFDALAAFLQNFGTASRKYAQQQMHWFLRDRSFAWLSADPANPRAVAEQILKAMEAPGPCAPEAADQDLGVREAQVEQGRLMPLSFVSALDRSQLRGEVLGPLLARADACTFQLPLELRRAPEAAPLALVAVGAGAFGKVRGRSCLPEARAPRK
ncbi:unnamed protein product, partial [Prorocentrum cordatum]